MSSRKGTSPTSTAPIEADNAHINVRGAREHNLKGVDISIPRDGLVVFTGLSGSGKSSLAFDTIYQEGQRRFMESLSAYARQFLGKMEKPKVDHVSGLSPTLSIDQKTVSKNPRSTVGTVTEILDHLRLLMARLGTPRCHKCHTEITSLSPEQIAASIIESNQGARVIIMAPIVRERKGEYRKELGNLKKAGWVRARIDGKIVRLDDEIELARYEKHTIEVVLDRTRALPEERDRIVEAIENGLKMADGVVTSLVESRGDDDEWNHAFWSSDRACPNHPEISLPELEPRLFSFNDPQGACETCNGLGREEGFDPTLIIDEERTIPSAILPLGENGKIPFSGVTSELMKDIAKKSGANLRKKWKSQPPEVQDQLLYGIGAKISWVHQKVDGKKQSKFTATWRGLIPLLEHVWRFTKHGPFNRFRESRVCLGCNGRRLNPTVLAVTFRDKNIYELTGMTLLEARAFFEKITLTERESSIGKLLIKEIKERLSFLNNVGLGYLSLDRPSMTLSGGEAQRIRLAAQVGSGLQGVTYVLDEPSIGLHPRDNAKLLGTLEALRDRGNSVLVVEHDTDTIRRANWMVDIGPKAGVDGGEVLASCPPSKIRGTNSLTARYLTGELSIPMPSSRRIGSGNHLEILGAHANNLEIDVSIPLGLMVVVTGVSGSGKSSLVNRVLTSAINHHFDDSKPKPELISFSGGQHIDKFIVIDQSPIGRTPRSNPATYTGAFSGIRELFAKTNESKVRGYKPGRFSFNVAGGRCEECSGAGIKRVEMQFLADVNVPCSICEGRRFNDETLEIKYRNKSITDVLEMPISEAAEFFSNHRKVGRILKTLKRVGMGYVKLGQPSTTLSGGEAQRIKLASELQRPATGKTLYLLDEPTTGLHTHDTLALVEALNELVDSGNSVVIIEHNTEIIKCADHIIDLGPEGGSGGGMLIGEGTPEHIATLPTATGMVISALPEFSEQPEIPFRPVKSRVKPPSLKVFGATIHNLKNVSVEFPHGTLTVITGVSGSGKSSLAFDTIFAEGQRRYVESLSTYARRFLGRMGRAPVDNIEGLAPSIAIQQKTTSHNPRSTVATTTEIYDYLRLLWAKIGHQHCPRCGNEVAAHSPSSAAKHLTTIEQRGWLTTKLPPSTQPEEEVQRLERAGFVRLLDGADEIRLEDESAIESMRAGATLVIDRFRPSTTPRQRLSEAVKTAYNYGAGSACFISKEGEKTKLTEFPSCESHGIITSHELTPRSFSFNTHAGACTACDGIGKSSEIDLSLLLKDRDEGLLNSMDGRVAAVIRRSAKQRGRLGAVYTHLNIEPSTTINEMTKAQLDSILYGLPDLKLTAKWTKRWGRSRRTTTEEIEWRGLIEVMEGWESRLEWLRREQTCSVCRGGRLRPESLAVTVGDESIAQHTKRTVDEALLFWQKLTLNPEEEEIAKQASNEVIKRLTFLQNVGLNYLTLDRAASTLSGGESQRIRLASQLGSGLTGCIYVLDEPTIGLHPKDTGKLLRTLTDLRDLGNTVLVVEHDEQTMKAADRIIDMGPSAGEHGGDVIASGTIESIMGDKNSVTGAYLSGKRAISTPTKARKGCGVITIKGANANNLQSIDLSIPQEALTVFTGVSGSGKSSLVMETLVAAMKGELNSEAPPAPCDSIELHTPLKRLAVVNQRPIGRSPRSTPATYVGVLDHLRNLYAKTTVARERGWTKSRFTFNGKDGRCRHCEGKGAVLIEMHFLSDVWLQCEHCRGKRYNEQTLKAKWKGCSIADVMQMRVDEAAKFFANQRQILRRLQPLIDVGLGYLRLGQPGTTLSGGEATRVKLAKELTMRGKGAVYVLDEPTTGLHFSDIECLIGVLHRLVDAGGTVIVVEHNVDVMKNADYIVDLGPDAGVHGGEVVAQGTPVEVASTNSHTGLVLKRELQDSLGRV